MAVKEFQALKEAKNCQDIGRQMWCSSGVRCKTQRT